MPTSDTTNITGLSQLLQGFDDASMATIEKDIVNDKATEENDDIGDYKRQLDEIGDSLGIESKDDIGELVSFNMDEPEQDEPPKFSHAYERVPFRGESKTIASLTEEQKKQSVISRVLSGVEDDKFNVDKEKEEDDKTIMLEQIDMLLDNLKDEGINLERIPHISHESTYEDVQKVLKVLRLKNDRVRYQSFAEESILATSYTLEWLFDGKKDYMGRKPDLTGWSATVNMKLRRMRYDTSTFVSDIMQDNNLGHGTRILLELIPSLFLYSKMKKSQYSDNILSSDEVNSAMAKIREMDEKAK